MKILLFGKNGQVGWELHRSLQPLGEIIAIGRDQADFSRPETLYQLVLEMHPDVIINAAAYTAVDKAEANPELAELINARSPGVLAKAASELGVLLVHYSTDYVFDGTKAAPYVETDATAPLNVYGQTKLAGEQAIQSSGCDHLIFRTSWVYASRGSNFLLTMLRLAEERESLSIVSDQVGAPTSARLIADATLLCMHQTRSCRVSGGFESGIYHMTSSGETSWYGFAEAAIKAASEAKVIDKRVTLLEAISTSGYGYKSARPLNSKMSTQALADRFSVIMPDWKSEMMMCIDELRTQ